MAKEAMNYDQIFAGEVKYITRVPVAAGEYKRGDLLENVVTTGALSATYNQCAAAGTAVLGNHYVVCAEDVNATEGDEVVAYKEGFFNKDLIMLNKKVANATSIEVLKTKNIFLETVK